MSAVSTGEPQDQFEAETARFRQVLARGRSANQLGLFDLLVERSRDQRSPKEVEIALALFGTDATLGGSSDSGVRVYVHRLRKRIDEHYAGRSGPRLSIPKGEYRLVLIDVAEVATAAAPLGGITRRIAVNPALSFGLSLIVVAGVAFASWHFWSTRVPQPSAAARERQALFGTGAALTDPVIAVGDSLLLAETEDQRSVQRMIFHPAIRTRDDLGGYMKAHPEVFYRLYDFNLNFAPLQAVEAAWAVQDELSGDGGGQPASVMPVSALNDPMIQANDIIFVGRLSQLGKLELPVFANSKLQLTRFDRLVDTASGAAFESEVYAEDAARAGPDIGYLAVLARPGGRRLIVMAGLGDRGTAAMITLLDRPQELALLKKRLGSSLSFEAVFEVQTLPGGQPERRLLAIYPRS